MEKIKTISNILPDLTTKQQQYILSLVTTNKEVQESIIKRSNLSDIEKKELLNKLNLTAATKANTVSNVAEAGSVNTLKGAFHGLTASIKAAWVAMSTLEKVSILLTVVSTAWTLISSIIDSSNQKEEEARPDTMHRQWLS